MSKVLLFIWIFLGFGVGSHGSTPTEFLQGEAFTVIDRTAHRLHSSHSDPDNIQIELTGGGFYDSQASYTGGFILIKDDGSYVSEEWSYKKDKSVKKGFIEREELLEFIQEIEKQGFFEFEQIYDCQDDSCSDRKKSIPKPIPLRISITHGIKKNVISIPIFSEQQQDRFIDYPDEIDNIVVSIKKMVGIDEVDNSTNTKSLTFGGPPMTISKLDEDVVFDGKIDEPFWSEIEPFKLVTQIPNFGEEPTERSEIRLAYDDEFVYLAGRLFDSEPEKIMANTKKRDALTGSTQWFGLVIDSYNDNENALAFFTTPTGLRLDAAVFNDGNGDFPINLSWNNFWDVKTTRDNQGWNSEIRIPFSSLAFDSRAEQITMGVTTWRYVARKGEVQIFPAIPAEFGDWSSWKPSFAQDMIFNNVKSKKPFYLTPYILGGFEETNELNDPETEYIMDQSPKYEAGLDVKYGISNNWTLDLSLNTDFAQVEADDQQINLTRFSLFFPEKRLFFQERSGIFSVDTGRGEDLFYSRRIGIDDDGNPLRILGGARLVGRSGPLDVGMLSMQTARQDTIASENFTVVRLTRNVFNENSNAGFMVTNRIDTEGNYNTAYALDSEVRLYGTTFLRARFSQTFTDSLSNDPISFNPSKFWISVGERSQRGFSYGASISGAGKDYDPQMGFQQREDYLRQGMRLSYNWFPGSHSSIFRHGFRIFDAFVWSLNTDRLESLFTGFSYQFESKKNWGMSFDLRPRIENIEEAFDLSDDIEVPVGDYSFMTMEVEFSTPFTKPIVLMGGFEYGSFYDGRFSKVECNPTYNVSASLELSANYQYSRIDFQERNKLFQAHLIGLRALYMHNTKLSIAAFLQYNSLDKNFIPNIRLRYNPSEGNDLYIVYNDNLNTDQMREIPNLPKTNARTILIKYSYTFRL